MASKKKKVSKKKSLVLPWQQQLAKYAKDGKAPKEAPVSGDIISIKGQKFSLGDRNLGRELDCVILGWSFDRSYYDSPYVDGEASSPACFAISYTEDDMEPHDESPVPQGNNCEGCEMNEWGSGTGNSKACAERRRLVLAVEGAKGEIEIKRLNIPPTSLKNWKGFISKIEAMGLHTMQCAVNIHFDEGSTAAYVPICFDFVKEITKEKTLQAMAAKLDETEKLLEQPYDVSNYTAPGKGKTKKKASKKKAGKKRSKFS